MPFIPLQYLLRPTTAPDQEILLNDFFRRFNNNTGVHKNIRNIEPIYFSGLIAGTEFLTYVNTKLYIAFELSVISNVNITIDRWYIRLHDELDNVLFSAGNQAIFWNVTGTAPNYFGNPILLKNQWFSRLFVQNYDSIIFNGYRITLS
jgi:hypothetical protein